MKKNAFTLIELLAVIVILAIIALIATPIILGIINDSKEQSTKRSAENYIDAVEQAIVRKNLEGEYNPKECKIENGEVTCKGKFSPKYCEIIDGQLNCDGVSLEVEIDGEIPTGGTIIINNGAVADGTTITIGNITYIKENGELVKDKKESIPEPESFATDSWETIVANINSDKYKVGDTREIELKGFENEETDENGVQIKTYTIRIANITSADSVCKNDNYSKTACGFVVEFEDIITEHNMNPPGEYKDVQYDYGWNVDGYPASSMYKFINEEKDDTITSIYESLPEDLKGVIIDTKVVSSHGGTTGETNFISTDKLYLLSTKEVYGKAGTSNIINNDTAEVETRQLEFYKDVAKVTTSSTEGAIKKYKGSSNRWWLRSANFSNTYTFYNVSDNGGWGNRSADNAYGVAPAFRIG